MPRRRVPFLGLLIFLLAVLLLTAGGRIAPQDEETVYRMAANLIERGQLTITEQTFTFPLQTDPGFLPRSEPREFITTWSGPGVDGRIYPQYTHAQSLLEIPLYLIGRVLSGPPTSLLAVEFTRFTTSLFNAIVIALTGWLLTLFAIRFGFSQHLSVGLGLTYALGTMAVAYTHTNFSEPLLALLFTLAAYALYSARVESDRSLRWLAIGGAALGLAFYTRERSAIMLPAFFLYVFWTQRWRWKSWLIFLIPIGLAGVAIGAWNWLRFGSPLITSYGAWQPETGFSTPILLGLFGLVLSPGKGLLIYNPIGWLGLIGLIGMIRRRPAEALLFGLTLIVPIGFFATYDLWTGGWNWGPRYLLPLLPFLLLTAGEWLHVSSTRLRRGLLIGLCVIGFAINVPTLLVDHSRYLVEAGERDQTAFLRSSIIDVGASPLTQQWPTVVEVVRLYSQPQTWTAARAVIDDHLQAYTGSNDLELLSTHWLWVDEFLRLNVPDLWFVHLWLIGYSPLAIGLAMIALLAAAVLAGRRVLRMLR
jgi:hypothetical protein